MSTETERLLLLAALALPMLVCLLPRFLKKHPQKVTGFVLFYGVTVLTGSCSASGMIYMLKGSYYWAAGFYLLALVGIILLLYRFNMEFLIPEKIRQKAPKVKPVLTELKIIARFLRDFYANVGFRLTEWSRRWLWGEIHWPGKLVPAHDWNEIDYQAAGRKMIVMLCADVRFSKTNSDSLPPGEAPEMIRAALAKPVARIGAVILYNMPYFIAAWILMAVGDRGAGFAILMVWWPMDFLLVFCEADPGAKRPILARESDPMETFLE